MYRIRRESGDEVNFGSIDELGAAVAAGIVTAKAEIFHARAEKWLPIASHPHFKMAHDRINAATAPRAAARAPGLSASGQRPALGASGQRPAVTAPSAAAPTAATAPSSATAPRAQAPQLRVVRPEATAAVAPADSAVGQKPAPRWNSAQRPAARAVAPKPSTPQAPPASDLRLVRADTPLNGAATAPALPEMDFELLPTLDEPAVIEPAVIEPVAAPALATAQPAIEPATETVVERSPAPVELVSHEEQPASARGEVEFINPDRSMPVMGREVEPLEIPAPIRDFTPVESAEPAPAKSRAPLFIGLGLVAAAAAVIGFFVLKPSGAPPAPAPSTVATQVPAPQPAVPVAEQPAATPTPAPSAPTGASTGLGGDVQARKSKKSDDSKATSDGLEPPPEDVMPAAPRLGSVGDAALPTVEAGGAGAVDHAKALEKTRREIDSSMRQ